MSQRIEALPWDSDFFDLSIGQVDLNGADPNVLDEIVIEARDRKFDCVYGSHEPADTYTSLHAQDAGFRLVEINQLMKRPPGPFATPPTRSVVRTATEDDLHLISDSLDTLAPWSRFGADPRFGTTAARRLHSAWVHRAVTDPERLATISEDEDGIDGVGTHVWGEQPRIDLLGVIRPGTGAAWQHIAKLIEWADGGEVLGGPCAARNIAPLRFLEHCGFALTRVTYTHHWWAT
ncbi:MAG: hypothetical protein R2707_16665 [Acidimicrobiales bacterium]